MTDYPVLLFADDEVLLLHNADRLSAELHCLPDFMRENTLVLDRQGAAYDADGHSIAAPPLADLAQRVATHLANEGHCCVAKLAFQNIEEVFRLLENAQAST